MASEGMLQYGSRMQGVFEILGRPDAEFYLSQFPDSHRSKYGLRVRLGSFDYDRPRPLMISDSWIRYGGKVIVGHRVDGELRWSSEAPAIFGEKEMSELETAADAVQGIYPESVKNEA